MKSSRFQVKSTQNYKSKCFSKNSSVWWMQGGGFHPWNPVDFTLKSGGFHPEIWWISPRFHLWNPPKIIKASVSAKTLQFDECRVGDFTLEIQWISPWNLVDFTCEIWWISPRFHLWNPPKIIKASVSAKTLQFDECRVGDFTLEIQWISPWNLVDFTCEIWWISPRFHLWNPPKIIKASVSAKTLQFDACRVGAMTKDFMKSIKFHPEIWWISPMKSGRFHPDFTCEIHPNYKSKCFSKNSSVWWMQGGGFHPWNPPDFTLKSGGFHLWNLVDFTGQIWVGISPWNLVDFTLKSGGFHPWNLADFTQISPVKSTQNYKSKCFSKNSSVWWMEGGGFHPRNPMDFTHEIWWISPRFHLWNPPKIIKASVLAKTLQFDECRVGDFTLEIQWISPWNLVDFNHEIWWISPRFHLWNPPKIIKASVSAKTLQFDECRVGAMTKDFMKSTRFYPEIWWISPVKSSRVHPYFIYEIHPKL